MERRDGHYQMVLENIRDPKEQYGEQKADFKEKQSLHIFQLLLPDGKGPCQFLPQPARNHHLQINYFLILPSSRCLHVETHILTLTTNDDDSTCNILLKNNFGSFQEVLSNDKNFLFSSH